MRLMLPIGIKIKKYYEKINITGQIQTNIEKEINDFYKKNNPKNIPLNDEPFDGKSLKKPNKINKTKKTKIKIH